MGKKAEKLVDKISRFLKFSPNILKNDLTITIYFGVQAVVSGFSKINEYDANILVVSNGKKHLIILGEGLILKEMFDDGVVVEGNIFSAKFENMGG